MSIRYLIAAALMASACAAHADVIPTSNGVGVISGSNVAGAVGDSSVIAGVNRGAGSDALVQALYEKVSASVGSDMKVSLKQGIDGVYVTGLNSAKAAALAGDSMSVIKTSDGFKIVDGNNGNHAGFTIAANPHAADATTGVGIGNGGGGGAAEVPEPSSIALMLAGMLGAAGLVRRRSR
jgi:hypothetical protein